MLILIRRCLVLIALMFWLGGFTFYAAVVVPIGQEVLGSHFKQGTITRQVSNYLNISCAIALLPLGWDVLASRDSSASRRCARGATWVGILGFLGALLWLHPRLDALLDLENARLIDPSNFRTLHRLYLWISTLQWGCGLGHAVLGLQSWRAEDGQEGSGAIKKSRC